MSSKDISFSNLIPWLFVQTSFIGDWSVNLLLPIDDQTVSEFGISMFLSFVTNPLSTK